MLRDRFDHALIVGGLRGELFDLTRLRPFRNDPMALMYSIDVTNYMDRSYAPVEQRIASMARLLRGAPAYLEGVRSLLAPPLPAPVLEQGIEAYEGIRGLLRGRPRGVRRPARLGRPCSGRDRGYPTGGGGGGPLCRLT